MYNPNPKHNVHVWYIWDDGCWEPLWRAAEGSNFENLQVVTLITGTKTKTVLWLAAGPTRMMKAGCIATDGSLVTYSPPSKLQCFGGSRSEVVQDFRHLLSCA